MPLLVTNGLGRSFPVPFVEAERDWGVLEDIRSRLEATYAFQGVFLSQPIGEGDSAVVGPWKFDEIDHDEDEQYRHVQWQLTITVRNADAALRDREIDRLYNVAANVLDGQSLGGICLPGLTKLRRGEWQKPDPPSRQLVCTGEFVYLIEGDDGHGTTE